MCKLNNITKKTKPGLTVGATLAALLFASSASAGLVVDRGLPNINLNNAAGGDRSNVAWGFNGNFLAGDDFTLDPLDPDMKKWRIDRISVWVIGGEATLGDRFDTITLFLGPDGSDISAVRSANLNGNDTDNATVAVSQVNYPGTAETYQGSSGNFLNMWQIDFDNLGGFGAGLHLFALGGVGPNDPVTFNHASNAALSGTPQQGADDQYRWFSGNALDASIGVGGFIDSDGNGWDKSSDINIQVYATQVVPEPMSIALMGLGLVGLAAARRRGNRV